MKQLTALLTGASEGLGKSFAFELAGRGTNLVLVSLPESGLPELSAFIKANFNVEVTYFELDLTATESFTSIFRELDSSGTRLDILVNNVGLGSWCRFEEKTIEFY